MPNLNDSLQSINDNMLGYNNIIENMASFYQI